MFLLNQKLQIMQTRGFMNLHPIMFLLNHGDKSWEIEEEQFTSHYVPIKSLKLRS